jgi:DNA-binding transcriptional MerR regulator
MAKSDTAFRTIGEVSDALGVPQHVLRYWETRFPQLRPITRAGNRRYYRPEDVALVRRIQGLLGQEGYTVRGVQQLLGSRAASAAPDDAASTPEIPAASLPLAELKAIRALLADALAE